MIETLISKKESSIRIINELKTSMQCPICSHDLYFKGQLHCENNHGFDLSKTGYINLCNQPDDLKYTKNLFEHRHKIMGDLMFYKPLVDLIENEINEDHLMLDAGCGEGSLLNQIKSNGIKAGIDLSKQGIQHAAKHYRKSLWMIADLAKIPFHDDTVNVLLSILSPANYQEFKRVLAPAGLFIKVIPGGDYFKEIRLHQNLQAHDNSLVLKRFKEEFEKFEQKELYYEIEVDQETRQSLLIMSPLAWNMSSVQKQDYLENGSDILTINLVVLIAKT